jgi:phosphoenolpyruvate synthase/pyruvate phosphate dikinase
VRWILEPDDPRCREEAFAGGKGASLARLARLGVRVPRFCVVSAEAFRVFALSGPTDEFAAEISAAVASLDRGAGIAVRSSALGEDSEASSYAGLYHTTLETAGPRTTAKPRRGTDANVRRREPTGPWLLS